MALKIIKHCKDSVPQLVTGLLLGLDIGSTLEVTNCFPFPVGSLPVSLTLPLPLEIFRYIVWFGGSKMHMKKNEMKIIRQYYFKTVVSTYVMSGL